MLTVPLTHSDGVFNVRRFVFKLLRVSVILKDESEMFEEGFVTLTNLEYRVFLSLGDYEDCLSDTRQQEAVCTIRPCLVRWEEQTLEKIRN